MTRVDKVVVVTKKTWLEELIDKFNTKSQAKFYIEHMGGSFEDYELAHKQYYESLGQLKKLLPSDIKTQLIEKSFLPNFLFGPNDLVVVIGQDGLVINTAKYLETQKIIAINPDPERFDGIMLPFKVEQFPKVYRKVLDDQYSMIKVTMALALLNNNQKLYGVNDLFIGHKSHGSALYTITFGNYSERQSSSGIIVSTGAGSTAWFRSIITGAVGVVNKFLEYRGVIEMPTEDEYRFPWDASFLKFNVREPFVSKTSNANVFHDIIYGGSELIIESHMPENGVIFSDGIESDFLEFNSGSIAKISVAEKKAHLVSKID
jgi:NAD kinase